MTSAYMSPIPQKPAIMDHAFFNYIPDPYKSLATCGVIEFLVNDYTDFSFFLLHESWGKVEINILVPSGQKPEVTFRCRSYEVEEKRLWDELTTFINTEDVHQCQDFLDWTEEKFLLEEVRGKYNEEFVSVMRTLKSLFDSRGVV